MAEQPDGVIWDALAGKLPAPPCVEMLGSTFVELEPGRSRMSFAATEKFNNPAGAIQGGFLAAMLDDTLGPAAASTVDAGQHVTTIELKVSFLRPARPGRLFGDGRVVHRGRSIIFTEGSLTSEDGTLLATATGTWRVVAAPNEEGA